MTFSVRPACSHVLRCVCVVALALVGGFAADASAQETPLPRHILTKTFGSADGFAPTTVYDIALDGRNWIWAGTQAGATYYDGSSWHALDSVNRTMRAGFYWGERVVAEGDSLVWFGTWNGLYALSPDPPLPSDEWLLRRYGRGNGLPADSIFAIHPLDEGRLLVSTRPGLHIHEPDGDFTALPPLPNREPARSLFQTSDGSIWAAMQGALFQLLPDGTEWRHAPVRLGTETPRRFTEMPDGDLLFGGIGRLVRYSPDSQRVEEIPLPNGAYVFAITRDHQGNLWMATNKKGLLKRTPTGTFYQYDHRHGVRRGEYHDLLSHPDGSLWITSTHGVSLHMPTNWAAVDTDSGLRDEHVWSFLRSRDGSFWIGTENGISAWNGTEWNHYYGPVPAALGRVMKLVQRADGSIWAASRHGIFRYDGDRFTLVHDDVYTHTLIERPDGSLLAGTRNGIFRVHDDDLERFAPEIDFIQSRPIKALYNDADGSLWAAAEGSGALHIQADGYTLYTEEDGLARFSVLDIYRDTAGRLWLPTTEGVSVFDGTHWATITDLGEQALPSRFTYNIVQADDSTFYVSTNGGISRLTVRRGDSVRELEYRVRSYGFEEGLPSLIGNLHAAHIDEEAIWFGTKHGAVRLDRTSTKPPPITPLVTLTSRCFSTAERSFCPEASPDLKLDHDVERASFSYVAGSSGHEDVQYRTQLAGQDEGYSEWTTATTRHLSHLAPGDYVFRVQARIGEGPVSAPAELAFAIAPPLWRTPFAYAGYVLLILGLGAGALALQRRRLGRLHRRETELEQVRLSQLVAESQAALLESENRRLEERNRSHLFRQRVMESTAHALFALDREGRLTLFNQRLEELLGGAALPGARLADGFSESDRVEEALDTVLSRGEQVRDLELQIEREGESTRHIALTLSPLGASGDEGVVGTARDVTEVLELEQFRDDTIRMLVHDLRSPIASTLMISREIAEANGEMPDQVRDELLALVMNNSEQALELVKNMLDMSRLEAGKMPVRSEPVVATPLIDEVVALHEARARRAGVDLCTRALEPIPPVCADESLLRRVLSNVLDNALNYTNEDDLIRVAATVDGEQVHIRVEDTGPGVDPALRSTLFEKFVTNGSQSGTGLGLAFCRLAMSAMEGSIHLDSDYGAGAAFVLTLKVAHP